MPEYTTLGISYPIPSDTIKLATLEAKLADDIKQTATTSNQAIITESGRAKTDSIADATTKYGGLPARVAAAETVTNGYPQYVRGILGAAQSLDAMTSPSWNGWHTVASANLNPGLPAKPGVAADLEIRNTLNDSYQRVIFRDGAGDYERSGSGGNLVSWVRIDGPFAYKGILPGSTALSSLTKARDNGRHIISASSSYPDLPVVLGTRQTAMLLNHASGFSDTLQRIVFRFSQGVFEREQLSGTVFSPWRRVDTPPVIDFSKLEARLALLEAQQTPETVFENTLTFTSYAEGEAYMDWLARRHKKLTILDLGASTQGRAIRAFRIGDPTKPTLYVMASQHGDEPMGREAAYIWVRQMVESTDPALLDLLTRACIVVTPVVNVDRINVNRLSSTGTDINTFWVTKVPKEIQAASKVLDTHDVVLFIDAHEGGGIQMMKTDTPGAPEVAQVLKTQTLALQDHIHQELIAKGEQAGIYPGEPNLKNSRNAVAAEYKCASLLLEGPSMLHENMYYPSVAWRKNVYLMTYDAILGHFTANLPAYITAKAAA